MSTLFTCLSAGISVREDGTIKLNADMLVRVLAFM